LWTQGQEPTVFVEKNPELEGINVAGKILVYPTGKGSTVGSFALYEMARCKTAPKGIINIRAEPITANINENNINEYFTFVEYIV